MEGEGMRENEWVDGEIAEEDWSTLVGWDGPQPTPPHLGSRPAVQVHENLAGGRGPDCPENPGADDRADREHDQVAGAEHALERLLAFRHELGYGFALKQLRHEIRKRR